MQETRGATGLILVTTPVLLFLGFFVLLVIVAGGGGATATCTIEARTANPDAIPDHPVSGYSGTQLSNAALIINAAAALDLDRHAQLIGVMVAMGESSLTILDHGDTTGPDSRGLFQQRDNGAWGSYDDRMDPTISATNFYTALTRIPNWAELMPTIAAHKVQGNADPFHYEAYYAAADAVVTALTTPHTTESCATGPVSMPLSPGFTMTDDFGERTPPTRGASRWHPAVDLQHASAPCGDQISAITAGTVTYIGGYQITIKSPDGYDVTYMHMKLADVTVSEGEAVQPSQPIALVGSEGPSTGCHLDLRINTSGSSNPAVNALSDAVAQGGPPDTAGYVNPEDFYRLHGLTLCDATCHGADQ
jgi:murein DD-endopeptidase MepM/ murein hydrolase activator NlpD